MNDIIQIGHLTIFTSYIIFALSGIFATLWAIFLGKYYHIREGSKVAGEWVQALLLTVLIWKFSDPVFHPIESFQNPLRILFLNGGKLGWYLGIFISLFFYFKNTKKFVNDIHLQFSILISTSILFMATMKISMQYLYGFSIENTLLALFFIILTVLYLNKRKVKSLLFHVRISQWYIYGWLVVRIMSGKRLMDDWNLWFAMLVAIILLIIDFVMYKGRDKR